MKLLFKKEKTDGVTGEKYKKDNIYEFTDKRGNEILAKVPSDVKVVLDESYELDKDGVIEEETQAVAKAVIEVAKEDNKTVEEIINEIVEESNAEEVVEVKPKKNKKK